MRRTYYGANKPDELEISDDGQILRMRLNIESSTDNSSEQEPQTSYSAIEVNIHAPFSQDKAIAQAFGVFYPDGYESKLVNEYNSATMGLYSEPEKSEKVARYRAFLVEREALKSNVRRICNSKGIQ